MKAEIIGHRIVLHGPPKYSPSFSSIPGSRWDKRYGHWTYAISPISAVRISQAAHEIGEAVELHPSMERLVAEWQNLKQDLIWKTAKGKEAAERALQAGNVFQTSTTPWVHQVCAGAFIEYKKAWYLGMRMRTGKTLVAIERLLSHPVQSCLILCPKSVIDVWAAELDKHAPTHPYQIIPLSMSGGKKKTETLLFQREIAELKSKPYIVIVNYDAMIREPLKEVLLKHKWGMVIADEGHKLKSAGGVTSKTAARLQADSKGILSGTPFSNGRMDAFGQFRFIDPAAFGTSIVKFRSRYCEMGGYGNYEVVGWKNIESFNKIIDLYMFRVDEDVLNLPPIVHMYRHAPLTRRAEAIYKKLERHFITSLDDGTKINAVNVLSKAMKLREICSGFVFDEDGNVKLIHEERKKALKQLLIELDPSEKITVFCEFTNDLDSIREVAESVNRTYGEVSGRRNDLVRGVYPQDVTVLGVNPKSGGVGVDCSASRYCVFYTVSFNGGDHDQAKSRVLGTNQKRDVTYIYLIAPGTIEEVVYAALVEKKSVEDSIMDYVKRGGSING